MTLVTMVVGLWLTPFTLRFLNREEYAIFTLAGDMLMWLGLLDIGISAGLNVQAAQLSGKPDIERLNRLASTSFFTQNIVSLVILIIGIGSAFLFPRFFAVSPLLTRQAIVVTALLAAGAAINMFVQTFSSLLIANQQMHVDNLIRLSLVIVRTVLTIVFLLLGWRMLSLAIANLVAVTITALLAVLRVWRLLPDLQIKRKWFSWDVLKSTGQLGIWFSLGGLAGIVITNLDRIVAAKIISLELVTSLSLTGRVYVLSAGLLQQLTNTARPMLGQLFGNGKMEQAYERYRQIFILSTGITVIAAASLLSINRSFVGLWVGKQNYGGIWLDLALAMNMIVHAWVLPNRAVLSSNMIVRPQTLSRLVEGVLNITLSILLAKWIGVTGVVISTAIAGILTSNWYLPLLTLRMFNRSYKDFLLGDGLRLTIFAAFLFSLVLGIHTYFGGKIDFLANVFISLMVGLAGLLLFWFLILEISFRQFTVAQLQKAMGSYRNR